jgi:hypothetical protein
VTAAAPGKGRNGVPVPGPRSARMRAPVGLAVLAMACCLAAGLADPASPDSPLPACPFKALTGWDCPGCGSTRMLHALLHGNPAAAARYNALAIPAAAFLLWRYGRWSRDRWVGRPSRELRAHPAALWGLLVVVLAWGVLRNLPFVPFTALHV